MNKKLLTIFLVTAFLLASISYISAAEASDDGNQTPQKISVKIEWNDDVNASDRPSSVNVSLMKDGKVVETKTLSENNSWSVNFTVDENGSFSVKEDDIPGYSISIKGNESKGFIIINTPKTDKLGAATPDDPVEENDTLGTEENGNQSGDDDTTVKNNITSDDNNTNDNKTEDNSTAPVVENQNTTKIVKKPKKDSDNNPKPKNNPNINLKNTGIPILLVVGVLAVAYALFKREK